MDIFLHVLTFSTMFFAKTLTKRRICRAFRFVPVQDAKACAA